VIASPMRYRWKVLALLLMIALIPLVLVRVFGLAAVRRLSSLLVAQTSDTLTADAQTRFQLLAEAYSHILWRGRERIEMALALQVNHVEKALSGPGTTGRPLVWAEAFNHGIDLPQDAAPLTGLKGGVDDPAPWTLLVAPSTQVFAAAPGIEWGAVAHDAGRLLDATAGLKELSEMLGPVVLWQYTVLANGLLAGYPAHSGLPRSLDATDQPWYRTAMEGRRYWTDAYIDPATRQLVMACARPVHRPDGTWAGATAIVIAVGTLLDQPLLSGSVSSQTCAFMSYIGNISQTGQRSARIFATNRHHERQHRSWRVQPTAQLLVSGDEAGFQAMLDEVLGGRGGIRRMPFEGRDSLWAWGPTQHEAFFVLIVPYEEILQPARIAEATVQENIGTLKGYTAWGFLLIAVLVVAMALRFSRTVTRPLQLLLEGAQRLSQGRFDTRVDIATGDEFEDMGKVFNAVVPRLEEHTRMSQSLALASEVQARLLPAAAPTVKGLDLAGRSLACDETSGDYYDFIVNDTVGADALAVAVGDVSGHGIPSALLMATARAFLRQRRSLAGAIEFVVADVNRQLTRDLGASGGFMTLFYAELDRRRICWVRAGHDPAILYDPAGLGFSELGGKGVALGLDEASDFAAQSRTLAPGQVVVIGTDGIWETQNSAGEQFGKARLRQIISRHAAAQASRIADALIEALTAFRGSAPQEDDITLVVVKVTD